MARTLSDTTAPGAPTLSGSRSGFTIRLAWTGATDDVGWTGYTIYRAGVAIGTTAGSAYTDTSPPLARTSSYTVRARDAAGNLSALVELGQRQHSGRHERHRPHRPGWSRPRAPGRSRSPGTHPATTPRVTNYYLFRGNAKHRLLGNVTSYTDSGLTTGTRYTYKVYALDAAVNWSGPPTNVSCNTALDQLRGLVALSAHRTYREEFAFAGSVSESAAHWEVTCHEVSVIPAALFPCALSSRY